MASLAKAELDLLRAKIAAIEKRPVLAEGAAEVAQRVGSEESHPALIDVLDLLVSPAGTLHEVFADEPRNGTAALGFTLGLARALVNSQRQAIIYLQLAGESQELGLPYGVGLKQSGIDPACLVIGRIGTVVELLWAMEEAIACRAVAGVITDITTHPKALDFTASRRLSLRAAASGTSVFLLRYGRNREASAAKLRWRVSPAPSGERQFDARAPGLPRFLIDIEKRRLGDKTQRTEGTSLLLDWTENGFVSIKPERHTRTSIERHASLPRPVPAVLGYGLPKAS